MTPSCLFKLHFSDWLPFFPLVSSKCPLHILFLLWLSAWHTEEVMKVQYRWGVEEEEEEEEAVVVVVVLCVSALVTGPCGPLPGCAFTWTLPPQSAPTSQTHLASLAGPAVALQPDPMIHSVGEISRCPAHSQRAVRVRIEQWDVKTALYMKGCYTTKNKE